MGKVLYEVSYQFELAVFVPLLMLILIPLFPVLEKHKYGRETPAEVKVLLAVMWCIVLGVNILVGKYQLDMYTTVTGAYKSGEYTVVEMTMKEQTDDIHADAYAGSVGHAITVLGDISKVLAEFPQFDVDVENANIAVHYVNATVKVKINKDGVIEKGTWKYTCDPEISHLDISGIMIDKADAKIDYIITVGGGF